MGLVDRTKKKIITIVSIGALVTALGIAGVVVGNAKDDDWRYKAPGYALTLFGGLTCAYGPGYVLQREKKKILKEIDETRNR